MSRLVLVLLVLTTACVTGDNDLPDCAAESLCSQGLYRDLEAKEIADGIREFTPTYVLWSDGAVKRRWLSLPPGTAIDNSDQAHWRLPVGARVFKEFVVDGKRIETRVAERVGDRGAYDDYRYDTYAWLDDESDARVVTAGVVDARGTGYDIPPRSDCITCHLSEPGFALGLSAIQLSGDVPLDVDDLARAGLLTHPARRYILPGDATTRAALGTLHANCGHCHSDDGIASFQRLKFMPEDTDLPVADTPVVRSIVGVPVTDWSGPDNVLYRIAPGDPAASAIYYRMSQRGNADQMPPLATEHTYDAGRQAVWNWIAALPAS